jgi:uncharacterized RDD family membrane protein YckC
MQIYKKNKIQNTLIEEENQFHLSCPNADFASRLSAFILDAIFLFLAFSFLQYVPFLLKLQNPWYGLVFNWAFFLFGYLWPLVQFGGTPAKLILGLRVIDSKTGETLKPFRALIRELGLKWIFNFFTFGIGILLSIVRKDSGTLHDVLTQSTVKRIYFEI